MRIQPILACASLALLGMSLTSCQKQTPKAADDLIVYFGTSTGDDEKGIYAYRFNPESGELTSAGLAVAAPNPGFLAVHPSRRFLYAVSRMQGPDGKPAGAVSAFSIDHDTAKLTLLNTVSSGGAGPCHLSVDQTGRTLVVANYGGGSVASYRILADGQLEGPAAVFENSGTGPNPKRQTKPFLHSANYSPGNGFIIGADLGTDQLLVFRHDPAKASLEPNDPPYARVPPGGGPRHFAFHPNGRVGYAINEIGNTVTVLSWDESTGRFTEKQTISTLPEGFAETSHTAEIVVHPSGRFVYGSNRGHDSIAVFSVNQEDGTLAPVEYKPSGGQWPRNFNLDPSGRYLFSANANSGNVVIFRVDQETGRLTETGKVLEIPSAICIRFVNRPS
ncbi:MAG: lactonase family protein [Bryobacterales bacterium]|nr:lactonase family protein [Bryobacterales bacterium]